MVLDWGMSQRLGHVALGSESQEVFLGEELGHRREYSEETARDVDQEVKKILDEAFNRARSVLTEHRAGLDALAEALVEHEALTGKQVIKLLGIAAPDGDGRERTKLHDATVKDQAQP
jgi:cell division protease FtsH